MPRVRWIASLSNGETIFEDRISGLPPAWIRLAQYIKENKLSITNLRAQIGPDIITLPANQPAYIQKKKIQSTGAWTRESICIGYAKDGLALIHQVGSDKSSYTLRCTDPGMPETIYNQ